MNEFKPCPFCGVTPNDYTVEYLNDSNEGDVFEIECPDCFARGPVGEILKEAISNWNKRKGYK